ncbi:MAG: BMC domain-containing protein [Myxococcales bacterium]|nr:BMC domain-containing protein [Myxococcales bacterium]
MAPSSTAAAHGPALAMLDIDDVPRGMLALDILVKEAEVDVYAAGTVQAGRYLLLFGGEVAPVELSYDKAVAAAEPGLRDTVLLPDAEPRIAPAILDAARRWPCPGDTLGVLQAGTSPTMLRAVDAALKGAEVDLVQLRVADGLGGRAIATLWGQTHDVEAALELAERARERSMAPAQGWSAQTIRNVDPTVARRIGHGTHFYREWRG